MAGVHQQVVAAPHPHALLLLGVIEDLVGDGEAVGQPFLAHRARDVEQHAAPDHLLARLLDAAFLRAGGGDVAAVVAVPHVVVVHDVAEAVPLRAALQRHDDDVVGAADLAVVEHAGIRVGAGAGHHVDRIEAAERGILGLAALRALLVVVERERDHLALAHQPRRGDDVRGGGEVERADLVVLAPAAPVLVALRRLVHVLARQLAVLLVAGVLELELGRHVESLLECGRGPQSSQRRGAASTKNACVNRCAGRLSSFPRNFVFQEVRYNLNWPGGEAMFKIPRTGKWHVTPPLSPAHRGSSGAASPIDSFPPGNGRSSGSRAGRRPRPGVRWIGVDLTDMGDRRRALSTLEPVTHVLYAARFDHPEGHAEPVDTNAAMLANLVTVLESASPLKHVHAVHGSGHGHQLGPVPIPMREDSARAHGRNFYFDQEDFLCERSREKKWTYSTSRPHAFCDPAIDHPRSIGLVIAAFAAIQRALGLPLDFPGSATAYQARTQFTDLALLARAAAWMATEPRCANEAFNVVNGDQPRWSELWPRFASWFGLKDGVPLGMSLAQYMLDKGQYGTDRDGTCVA